MRAWQVDADVASLSLAEIVMPPDTRVTSVSGADLLAWHVAIESSKPMSNSSNSVSAVTEKSVLHLQFRKSVMNDVVPIVITTELQISTGYVCCYAHCGPLNNALWCTPHAAGCTRASYKSFADELSHIDSTAPTMQSYSLIASSAHLLTTHTACLAHALSQVLKHSQ